MSDFSEVKVVSAAGLGSSSIFHLAALHVTQSRGVGHSYLTVGRAIV